MEINMKKIFILSVMFVFCACSVFAASYYDSVDQIKEFNPDGKKYEFVRDFIHSLSYLQANDDRSKKYLECHLINLIMFKREGN